MKKVLFFVAAALFGMAVNAQDTVFSENFEGVSVNSNAVGSIPAGWVVYEDNNENISNYAGFGKGWFVYNLSGASKCALSIARITEANAYCDRWLITPQFNVPTDEYTLFFELYTGSYEGLAVLVSTTDSAKESFTDTLMNTFPVEDGKIMLDMSAYAGQNIRLAFVNNTLNYNSNFIAVDDILVTKSWPTDDIVLYKGGAQRNAYMGEDFNLKVYVYNNGSETLNSFDIEYSINGGTPQTVSYNNQNIAPFHYEQYKITCNQATEGTVNITVTALNPNSQTDPTMNDNSVQFTGITVNDPANMVRRMSLLDHFTTARCQYCPQGHERMEEAIEGMEENIAWVAHHLGYYEDPMIIGEDYALYQFFPSGSWAPAFMLDRDPYFGMDGDIAGSVGSAEDMADYYLDAYTVPTYMHLNVVKDSYDPQTRQLTVTVSGDFVDNMNMDDPRVTIYAVEDGIHFRQQGTQGTIANYEHNHVARALFTNVWGDNSVITSTEVGSTFSKSYTITLPTKCHADKVYIVAFVSDYHSSARNRKVAQAAKTGYIFEGNDPTQSNVGIGNVETSINIKTFPNPATEMAYINADGQVIRSYSVVNSLGQKVINEENVNVENIELDVTAMPQGVYFINVTTDRGVATERLTVVK